MGKSKEKEKDYTEEEKTSKLLENYVDSDEFDNYDEDATEDYGMGYQTTLMYGHYTRNLGEFARLRKNAYDKQYGQGKHKQPFAKELRGFTKNIRNIFYFIWTNIFAKFGEDWLLMSMAGISMGIIAHCINAGVRLLNHCRAWMMKDVAIKNIPAQYAAWICLPLCCIMFASLMTEIVSPESRGSGVPEIKTMIKGVHLKGVLALRTLFAKCAGIICVIGAGMPLGKEGPLIHISCMVTYHLSRLFKGFEGIYRNKARRAELLAAGAALGVSVTFNAPVGGVLFSVEATTTYFFVRNYFRGFLAAVWGTLMLQLFGVWCMGKPSFAGKFQTHFTLEFPFDAQEVFVFALIGICCGVGGAMYVQIHRHYVLYVRKSKPCTWFFNKFKFLYPLLIVTFTTSCEFPPGPGQFLAGGVPTPVQVKNLFSNFSWMGHNLTVAQKEVVDNWRTPYTGPFANLSIFIAFQWVCSILCVTMPVPAGMFVPLFKIGGAFGRIIGELMNMWYSGEIWYFGKMNPIMPGGYAIVGAASFVAAVTHTVSVALIAMELAGTSSHLVPTLIACLLAVGVASLLSPSSYDSIIMIKGLPFLPDLLPKGSAMFSTYVKDFMVRDVKYIYQNMPLKKLVELMKDTKNLRCYPLVDNDDSRVLVGSIQRMELIRLVEKLIGRKKRRQVVAMQRQLAHEIAKQEAIQMQIERERRPSRFEVVPAKETIVVKKLVDQVVPDGGKVVNRSNSVVDELMPTNLGFAPYRSLNIAEKKVKHALESIFRKSKDKLEESDDKDKGDKEKFGLIGVEMRPDQEYDMTPEDRKAWEQEQLLLPVDFSQCRINPAPFQVTERTSLMKVHSLFNMMGIFIVYVTNLGRLIGVVGMDELKKAIEDANDGKMPPHDLKIEIMTKKVVRKKRRKEDGESDSDSANERDALCRKV